MIEKFSPSQMARILQEDGFAESRFKLNSSLVLPSYVHGYSIAIQYMYKWFESKFEKDYFKGGIYIDGKHVLDDYKQISKNMIKGQNPRARMAPSIEYDFDRETVDMYSASPEVYIRRSRFDQSFFKDYDRKLFLAVNMRAIRMNFNFKVRVSTRSQQLDLFNRMEMYFRIGGTEQERLSIDFHVPKSIMLDIANKAGFEIKDGEVVDTIDFLNYINKHSDIPFLFKIRAINQKPEFFIRSNEVFTHISTREKLSVDDGERDGKLDFNYHIEMNCTLTIPVPHYYVYYSADELTVDVELKEQKKDSVGIYTINAFEIPRVDEHGWNQCAITDCSMDKGDTSITLSSLFEGKSILAKTINHDMSNNISPSHFVNIKAYRDLDYAKEYKCNMNWEDRKLYFKNPTDEEILHIAIYYDREYANMIEIESNNFNSNRISKS